MKKRRTNAADDTARGYDEGIAAIRLEGVKAGRFLPRGPIEVALATATKGEDLWCGVFSQFAPVPQDDWCGEWTSFDDQKDRTYVTKA